ncbi:MAG: hypothetical protein IPN17_33790 [Deltaproteobacteria bacterium]|nr:hypothetical protein [Deltaproteobacteria bacterium]
MRSLRWILGAGLVLAACRSEGLSPVDTDSGAVDSGTTPIDTGVPAMDRPGSDACVPSGPENTAAACADNIDNDCNGFTDCRDFSCSRNNPAVTFCPDAGQSTFDAGRCDANGARENTAATCRDGMDNDCDGYTDCRDFNCNSFCGDGGAPTDRPACDSGGALENTAAACGDGVDNDCDGFVDCNDNNCSCQGACPPGRNAPAGCTCMGGENTTAACGDGIDNDCNGFRDCADFSCSRSTTVTVCRDASATDAPTDTGASTDTGAAAADVPRD